MELFANGLNPYGVSGIVIGVKPENITEDRGCSTQKLKTHSEICRLCLVEIADNNFTCLEGIIKDMLEIVLPELKLSICSSPSVCNSCLETLKQSYDFKSSCLEVEDKVQDFVDPKNPALLDLSRVIFSKVQKVVTELKQEQVICRTCLNVVERNGVTKLYSFEGDPLKNMIDKCLPEMGIELTKEPVICSICLELLEEQFNFLMQCLDTEEKIKYYCEKKNCYKQIDLHNVYTFSMCIEDSNEGERSLPIEEGTLNLPENNININDNIKKHAEELDNSASNIDVTQHNLNGSCLSTENLLINGAQLKAEIHETVLQAPHVDNIKLEDNTEIVAVAGSDNVVEIRLAQNSNTKQQSGSQEIKEKVKNKSKSMDMEEESESEEDPEDFSYYPTGASQKKRVPRKCRHCDFKTKIFKRLKSHVLSHHPNKPVPSLTRRRRTKEEILKSQIKDLDKKKTDIKNKSFDCSKCSLSFKSAADLDKHMDVHTEINRKKINAPNPYLTKHTYRFDRHMLTMYRCRLCPYQTRLKSNFTNHSKIHKTTSEIKTHKCTLCKFETIQKENLTSHMRTHDSGLDKSKMRKCFLCSFQTKRIDSLRNHVKNVHKAGSG